jgi:hypothetical protein
VRRVPASFDHAQAALAVARGAGLAVDRAEVARVASNVLVRLAQGAAYLAATGRGDVGRHLEWLRERASSV